MIVEIAVAGVFLALVWRAIAWALPLVERWGEAEVPFGGPARQDRAARQSRARLRALLVVMAPWVAWLPMLFSVARPVAVVVLFAAGVVLVVLCSLATLSWRPLPGWALSCFGALLQLLPLGLLSGLAAESRLDPEMLAQRATVVEMRRLGRGWWEWTEARRERVIERTSDGEAPHDDVTQRQADAALLLADRVLGWPAIRGLAGDAPRLVDASTYPPLDERLVEALLSPRYLSRVSLVDGWGRPLEIRGWLEPRDASLPRLLIRSAGADGRFDEVYRAGPFAAEHAGDDIVWADGAFLREPDPDRRRSDDSADR